MFSILYNGIIMYYSLDIGDGCWLFRKYVRVW